MKRLFTIYLVLFCSIVGIAQTTSGAWNEKTAIYTNTNHKITWKLIEELEWKGRPILTNSTLFRVRNDDTQILVSLGIQDADKSTKDIWDMLPAYNSKELLAFPKAEATRNGMELQYVRPMKSQLCGLHANKVKTDMTKYSPEYKLTMHSVKYMYQFIYSDYLYTLTVWGLSVWEDELEDFDYLATKIMNGFKIDY